MKSTGWQAVLFSVKRTFSTLATQLAQLIPVEIKLF